MCVSLNGTWIRTLRHEAAGVLHIGVDCMVHFVLACEIDIQKSIVVSVVVDPPSNLVKPSTSKICQITATPPTLTLPMRILPASVNIPASSKSECSGEDELTRQ